MANTDSQPKTKIVNGGINIEKEHFVASSSSKKIDQYLAEAKEKLKVNKDFETDMKKVYEVFRDRGIFNENGEFQEGRAFQKGNLRDIKAWSSKNSNLIAEVADNSSIRIFEKADQYNDPGESYVKKSILYKGSRVKIETAEDDRVLGIPYAQAMAGDRVYIINGKVFTGWALYFSLSSIHSPEDYARNVDLAYNVPYLFAALLLKAQLGLGTGFDVNYGREDEEIEEEKMLRLYLFDKLKINTKKLVKTGFHLGVYGNAYWALRRDSKGLVDKITILQPERLKIFLDPMTTKILFYIYLPPIIGGTTIASYPSDGRFNPNILTGVTLSYPTPIVMHPEDVMHFKLQDFTEYPFGFSEIKFCTDPATARLDVNILAPIIFKKYTKPMIHWTLNTEGLPPAQVVEKRSEMVSMIEDMEPGSDPVTTDRWEAKPLSTGEAKNDIFNLTADIDTQIFAATGAPETYFKPKGSTDRMISEQDKTFIARLKVPQAIVAEEIEEKLIKPKIDYEVQIRKEVQKILNGEDDVIEAILQFTDSYMKDAPKYPKVIWNEIFKQDETQAIANAIALTNAGIIEGGRAAVRVGEIPVSRQMSQDANKISLSNPSNSKVATPSPLAELDQYKTDPMQDQTASQIAPQIAPQNTMGQRADMEKLRGSLNVAGKKDESNRNINDVKDPSKLGGSRHGNRKLGLEKDKKVETADDNHYQVSFKDFMTAKEPGNYQIFWKIVNDKICIEMPTETQTFKTTVDLNEVRERLKVHLQAEFEGSDDEIAKMFMKMNFTGKSFYKSDK